ncbi:MAG TPA: hypothetical protein VN618_12905 [Solirubrobacteraceae bacterium]|nr:hypothetical protein [Solirubrobacteraceae bacterium]
MSLEPTGLSAAQAATGMANAPAWVRNGSAAVQKDYALGLQFERMLANQLASSMTASAGLGEQQGSEEEGSAGGLGGGAGGPFSTMLSGALAEGVAGGGLGLAAEIARDLQSRTGTTPAAGRDGASAGSAPATPVAGGTQAETTGGTSS